MTTTGLTDYMIATELRPYGVSVSPAQCDSIRTYIDLLLRWNRKVGLTTITDLSEILRFHIGESVFPIASLSINEGRLADVGSGAGFPGVPLALFSPKLQVTLIEANSKKAAFLAEIQRALCLNNAQIIRKRFEDVQGGQAAFDYVTARALGQYARLLSWCLKLGLSGRIVLWLGSEDALRVSVSPTWSWESIAIPGSKKRVVLTGRRVPAVDSTVPRGTLPTT